MTHQDNTCLLCGTQNNDVRMGLIAWSNPIGRDRFTAAPRCRDKMSCRDRVEAAGDSWDLEERAVSARELVK